MPAKKNKNKRCPRCKSIRVAKRLSGENYCERCGQRWSTHGLLIPSFDRRQFEKRGEVSEERQLELTII